MPFPSSNGFINEQSNIIITTTEIDDNENDRQQQHQIPSWLLEFHHDIHPLRNKSRPSSDNNITTNRPKWFEELSQKRRMSDIADFKYKKESLRESAVNQNGDSITDHYSKFEDNDTTIKDYKQPIDTEDISKTFEHSFDYNFKMKTPSKSAGVIDIHDDNLLSFTSATFKSIENLKLDEKTKIIEDCIIPEMPTGIELCLILMENWGDQNFIGLNGIEILDRFGNRPSIENVFLKNDENRKEYNDLYKLIDNVYRTHDDSHIWQCRFDEKKALPIRIIFRFEKPTTIALIRIWNYNKSRIHSYRGVKYAKVKLDEQTIFCGEIAKACGDLTGTLENFGDTILFTTDEEVLEHISHFDISFQELLMEQMN